MGKSYREGSWRNREGGFIHPKVKKCIICKKRRVKYHHVYCNKCWNEEKLMRKKQRRLIGL